MSCSPRSSSCRRRRYVSVAVKSLDTALTPTLLPSSQCVAASPCAATLSARTRSGAATSSSTQPHSRSPPRYAPPGPRASSSVKVRTPPGRMARAWVHRGDSAAGPRGHHAHRGLPVSRRLSSPSRAPPLFLPRLRTCTGVAGLSRLPGPRRLPPPRDASGPRGLCCPLARAIDFATPQRGAGPVFVGSVLMSHRRAGADVAGAKRRQPLGCALRSHVSPNRHLWPQALPQLPIFSCPCHLLVVSQTHQA